MTKRTLNVPSDPADKTTAFQPSIPPLEPDESMSERRLIDVIADGLESDAEEAWAALDSLSESVQEAGKLRQRVQNLEAALARAEEYEAAAVAAMHRQREGRGA